MAETGADVSVVFVPPAFTKDACIEAIDAGIGLLVVITEGVPVQDTAEVWSYLDGKSTRMIGPNCPGIITPGESLAGITPHTIAGKGPVGLVSKSGTLTYQMMYELRDFGFSTAIGIGGDPIVGTTHIDALAAFEDDPDTKAIVMIGEIGGDAEERAAAYIKDNVTKPVVGYVAGFTAPEGKTMGHAGAIVSGSSGTAAGEEGGPRGRRREGRQDAVRDRPADAGDPPGPLSRSAPASDPADNPGQQPGRHPVRRDRRRVPARSPPPVRPFPADVRVLARRGVTSCGPCSGGGLPELDGIAVGVTQRGEPTIGVGLGVHGDLDAVGAQLGDQAIEIGDPEVDAPARGSDVIRLRPVGEDGDDGGAGLLAPDVAVVRRRRWQDAEVVVVPLGQPYRVPRGDEEAPDSVDRDPRVVSHDPIQPRVAVGGQRSARHHGCSANSFIALTTGTASVASAWPTLATESPGPAFPSYVVTRSSALPTRTTW